MRRLAARSLRTTDADIHAILDPLRLGASVPQAAAILAAERPAAIFTTGGYVAIPVLMAAAPLGIPVVMWDGNVIPGRAVRATARLATALAVSFEATCRSIRVATPNRPCYVTGTPIREVDAIGRAAARVRMDIAPDERVMLIFGGSQAVRRFNAAVAEALPRLVERVTVIHVTGDEGYAAALAGREALPETAAEALPAVPVPARRDAAGPRGGRPRRRAGRRIHAGRGDRARPADGRRPVSARGRPPAGQRGQPRRGRGRPPGRGRGTSMRRRWSTRRHPRRSGRLRRDVRGGPLARPAGRRRRRRRPGPRRGRARALPGSGGHRAIARAVPAA